VRPGRDLARRAALLPVRRQRPGEGTQAKRRAHATVVDHLIPPMTRADTYDDLAKLEQLLDEYYQVETLDPSKLPPSASDLGDPARRRAPPRPRRRGAARGVRRLPQPRGRLPLRDKGPPDPRRPPRPRRDARRGTPAPPHSPDTAHRRRTGVRIAPGIGEATAWTSGASPRNGGTRAEAPAASPGGSRGGCDGVGPDRTPRRGPAGAVARHGTARWDAGAAGESARSPGPSPMRASSGRCGSRPRRSCRG
jgi:hypothetical protein